MYFRTHELTTPWRGCLPAALILLAIGTAGAEDMQFGPFELVCITSEPKVVLLEISENGVESTEAVDLPEGEADRLVAAPVGRRLAMLFRPAGEFKQHLRVVDLDKGKSRKIADFRTRSPTYPFFSPDGKRLGYVDGAEKAGEHVVSVTSFDGKRTFTVSQGPKVWDGPVFADSATVLFGTIVDDKYTQSLESRSVGGKRQKCLLKSVEVVPELAAKRKKQSFNPSSLQVWPRGRVVIWIDWGKTQPAVMQVRETSTAGGKSRWLTDGKRNVIGVRLSPDGKKIAWLATGEKLGSDDLFVMPRTGGKPVKLASVNKQPYRGWMFAWTPDSRHLAYLHNPSKKPGSMREVFVADTEKGTSIRVTNNDLCECYPAFLGKRGKK
jgi:dipeptidyl aminopeptidase/acylaminoacyl peptidase